MLIYPSAKDKSEVRDKVTSSLLEEAGKILTGLENVRYLIYDVLLQGTHPNVNELTSWTADIGEYRPEIETGTMIIPRKVINLASTLC